MADIPDRPMAPLRVAVSDCLLGAPVRYDGGHKKSSLPHIELAGLFEFVGFCPEMAIGLGSPRDPIRLVSTNDDYQALGVSDQRRGTASCATSFRPFRLYSNEKLTFLRALPSEGV